MTLWALVAAAYGATLAVASLTLAVRRRAVAATSCAAYTLVAIGSGTLGSFFAAHLFAPGALLLAGYWLSGFFFARPQAWLERFLLRTDRGVFRTLAVEGWLARAPTWVLEGLEAAYAADYAIIAGGAILAARVSTQTLAHYWTLVLASELGCYVALPWLRSRPPRALEPPGEMARRGLRARRLNAAILDRASVQANTIPSGHVAGAMAAALALLEVNPAVGAALLVAAGLVAAAAVAGRYHYVVDCVGGAALAVTLWLVV